MATRSSFDAYAAFGTNWGGIFLVDVRRTEIFRNSHLQLVCTSKRLYARHQPGVPQTPRSVDRNVEDKPKSMRMTCGFLS